LLRFPLMATSVVLSPGWRLRLALSGADFPVVWPPGKKTRLTFDPLRSRLILPTVPERDAAAALSIPPSAPPPSPPGHEGEGQTGTFVERVGSTTVYGRERSSTERIPHRDHLRYASQEKWTIRVDDDEPASLRVRSDAEVEMQRPGWSVSTTGHLDLSADADHFYLSIGLVARHNGEIVFSRDWDDRVRREWA